MGEGDTLTVYKANMIIPQVAENLTRSGTVTIPSNCPACNAPTVVKQVNEVKSLYCTNPLCSAKQVKLFSHFVSRNAMNIDGLSEATLEKFIDAGFLNQLPDLFSLDRYREEIMDMEGFGEKSYENLMKAIEKARHTTTSRFLYSLGIPNIGTANAKLICKQFHQDFQAIRSASLEDLVDIEGVGEVIAGLFCEYFRYEKNNEVIDKLLKEVTLETENTNEETQSLAEKNFVVTGSVNHFANRDELKALIESKGGKVTGSVTSKTHYLINNDVTSNSSKNKKAKELGVSIISEDDFLKMI